MDGGARVVTLANPAPESPRNILAFRGAKPHFQHRDETRINTIYIAQLITFLNQQ
jgi:hypothetical protein